MKFKLLLVLLIIFPAFSLDAQKEIDDKIWDTLIKDVEIKYIYSFKYNAVIPKPKFGKKVKELKGETITVKGFYLPVDVTGDILVLSYNPMSTCFFCTGDGLQTIIELNVEDDETLKKFSKLKTDDYFEVKGTLRLNTDVTQHLIYILDDVEFVKVVK